jgi:hypothetical protein
VVIGVKNKVASFFKVLSRKQAIAITICLSGIVVVSALAINTFWNQLPMDSNGTAQYKTEVASLLCEWRPSEVEGFFIVNVTNQHDFRVFGVMARGQFKNGSLLILEFAPPHDTLEPSQSHTVSRAGNAEDIGNINASGSYLVGADNTD